jgi:hypothetical protein
MDPIIWPWIAELGLISYRDYSQNQRAPIPSEFVSSLVLFGAFGLIGLWDRRLGALLGWGLVGATLLNIFTPAQGVNASTQDTTTAQVESQLSQNPGSTSSGGK